MKHDTWAVIIGVGRYQSTDIPSLRYTVSDAESLSQILVGPGAAANVTFTTGTFPVQSLWSNALNSDAGGCATTCASQILSNNVFIIFFFAGIPSNYPDDFYDLIKFSRDLVR